MNKRLKELALKAYNNAGQGTPEALSSFMEVYSEKFAKLLIRETMQVVANNMSADLYRVVANAVIEHYGDEE